MSEPLWQAWITAHHAIGCSERTKDVQNCRYRAAHIKTAKLFVELLERDGWKLVHTEAKSIPMFGATK